MIFLTVGAQMPFDRFVREVDDWAGASGAEVFAQIGETAFRPKHMQFAASIGPAEFRERCLSAEVILAHAGMGTILTALELGTPILVFPRRAALREMRNDHQVATARELARTGRVAAAMDEAELRERLARLAELREGPRIGPWADEGLLRTIRAFLTGGTEADE